MASIISELDAALAAVKAARLKLNQSREQLNRMMDDKIKQPCDQLDDQAEHSDPDEDQVVKMMEMISNIKLEMPLDGQRVLNTDLLNALKKKHEPATVKVLDRMAENTRYIPFSQLMESMTAHFAQFQKHIGDRPFHLYLPSRLKSTLLFAGHFWPSIRKMNFRGFFYDHHKIQDGMELLILDDCVYSGWSIQNLVDMAAYRRGGPDFHPYSGTIHLVLGYSRKGFIDCISKDIGTMNQQWRIYCDEDKWFNELSWSDEEKSILQKKLDCEAYGTIPVYFDHKIGAACSTYTAVYTHSDQLQCMTTHPPFDIKSLIRDEELVQTYLKGW